MADFLFLAVLGMLFVAMLAWGFKHLPGERWQMFAVVPLKKKDQESWHGANLTYYGFFVATSQLISLAILFVLLETIGVSLGGTVISTLVILAFSIPAARIVAMIVEKKSHTFTIGGASFVGVVVAPWAIIVTAKVMGEYSSVHMPLIPMLSAMSISYTFGEGLGRLACISYGCCYGKPIKDTNKLLQFLFAKLNFIFYGEHKKVAYEAQLTGEKLIPIQAITCIIYCSGALFATFLFLHSRFTEALLLTMALTQLWRILSETMRADFRGFGKISSYQKMGVLSVAYILMVCTFFPSEPAATPDIVEGVKILWQPVVIIGLQLIWGLIFYMFGRSTVTSSEVSFKLLRERI